MEGHICNCTFWMRTASTRGFSCRKNSVFPASSLTLRIEYFSFKLSILRLSAFLLDSTLSLHASFEIIIATMISGFSSALCVRPIVSFSNTIRGVHNHGRVTCLATSMSSTPMTVARDAENEQERRKYELLNIIQDTQRGLVTTADQRSTIEEAMVVVEGFDAGKEIDFSKLDGTWRLQYTSAPDVLVLFESAARLSFFQVGQIFQKFECQNESRGGLVRNVIKWSVPHLLEENEGATLIVSARFSCVSARNIYLKFEEIGLQNININDNLQAVIAPAILPRSFLSLQILQFIQTFKAQVPVTSPERQSVGGLYYLSYLDKNMLLGRAVGGGGIFVFTRAQALIC